MSSISAPIVLFVYNRPEHTRKTLEALKDNIDADQSRLIIYCDGQKPDAIQEELDKIIEVKAAVREQKWCREVEVIERPQNYGLAKNIISGVTEVLNEYGKVIVLEDDIVTSPGFLKYMNSALNLYQNEARVMHISGYLPKTSGWNKLPSTFFLRFMSCWGWGTWNSSWQSLNTDSKFLYDSILERDVNFNKFNLEGSIALSNQLKDNIAGKIDTWAIKWMASIYLESGLCLYPNQPLVSNIGWDGSGVHSQDLGMNSQFEVDLSYHIDIKKEVIKESEAGRKYLKRFYKYGNKSNWFHVIHHKLAKLKYDLLN